MPVFYARVQQLQFANARGANSVVMGNPFHLYSDNRKQKFLAVLCVPTSVLGQTRNPVTFPDTPVAHAASCF